MYKHLWIPKQTARDWGKTDYHVIRNWTPRAPQPATNQSDDHPTHNTPPDHSTALIDQEQVETTAADLQMEETALIVQYGPRSWQGEERPTTEREGEDEEDEAVYTTQSGRKRPTRSSSTGSLGKKSRLRVSTDSGTADGWEEKEEKGEGGRDTQDRMVGSQPESIEQRRILQSGHKKTSATTMLSQSSHLHLSPHVAEKRSVISEPVRLGGQRSEVREGGADGVEESEFDLNASTDEPEINKVPKRRTKRTPSQSSVYRLWQTRYQRNTKDLNELDICLSLYDSAMRDAVDGAVATPVVQRAMREHWKRTTKHVLSTIRDLSIVSALEKRHRQEVTKHHKLRQECLATLTALRQGNGKYLQSVSRAQGLKQAHKLSVEQAEVKELSRDISACAARLKSQH